MTKKTKLKVWRKKRHFYGCFNIQSNKETVNAGSLKRLGCLAVTDGFVLSEKVASRKLDCLLFGRAGGAGEDKRCWRRETVEEMFLLAAVPDAASLAVSVTSSVSSCYCSSSKPRLTVRRPSAPLCPTSLHLVMFVKVTSQP